MASKRRAVDLIEQEAAECYSQAVTCRGLAEQVSVKASAQKVAAIKAHEAVDLQLFSASQQLVQMMLWAGSLGYAVWLSYASA